MLAPRLSGWSRQVFGGLLLSVLMTPSAFAQVARECTAPVLKCPDIAALLEEREGYGRNAQGGLNGEFVVVTSNADRGPGTLRDALEGNQKPRWVRFASDMTITLKSQIQVPSNVTIDGRGHNIALYEYGFGVYNASNVIITHVTIDGRFKTFSQAVDVANFSRNVWLNHLDLSQFNARLVNIKNGSTDVTMSWIKFHNHNKVMLLNNVTTKNQFASWDRDSLARVTLHHSWFVDTIQRNPRAQLGVFHIYNNLIENWDFYGMSFSLEARATVEGNMFANRADRVCSHPDAFETVEGIERNFCKNIPKAGASAVLPNGSADRAAYQERAAQFNYTHDYRAFLKVRDNIGFGNAQVVIEDYQPGKVPVPPYCYTYDKPSAALADRIRKSAGVQQVRSSKAGQSCPTTAIIAAAQSAPVASGWKLLGRNLATVGGSLEAPQFSVLEVDGALGRHGVSRIITQPSDAVWSIEVNYKPIGDRDLGIVMLDPASPRSRIAVICRSDGASFQGMHPSGATAVSKSVNGGFYVCRVQGKIASASSGQLRVDLVTANGADMQPPGVTGQGVTLRNIRVQPVH